MSDTDEDNSVWLALEYDSDARRFVWDCNACGWSGETQSLHRATAGLGEHLRGCTGEPPTRLNAHYRPENFREAYPKTIQNLLAGEI